ncbi:YciI family protein [Puia sp.]|jgi:hypothetical protein|uniref:YciI family protein n=1 Tax=Puia sp. TaxID=2045100 RepID=UPI002F3EBEF7
MDQFLIIVKGCYQMPQSPEESQKSLALFNDWVQHVLNGGFVAGAPLDGSEGRLLKSKTEVLTDGPFMESKEMISGYIIINAADLAQATEFTKKCPLLDLYQLEVRKLKPMV